MKSRIASPPAGSYYPTQNSTSNTLDSNRRPLPPPSSAPNAPPIQQADYSFADLEWRRSNSMSSVASSTSQRPSCTGKVKIYYTFEGDVKSCFTTMSLFLHSNPTSKIIPLSLRQCLLAVCRASPEMGFDCQAYSVYSINHEEMKYQQQPISTSSIIWEGHGLLSQIIDTDTKDEKEISGEVYPCNSQQYTFEVHVTINLKSAMPDLERFSHEFQSVLNTKTKTSLLLEDTGKQPVLEAPYTNTVMDRQSSLLLSHFSNQASQNTHTFNRELPRILSRRNSMEDRRDLPPFQKNHLSLTEKAEFHDDANDFDSEYSNYEPSNEESSHTQRKNRTYAIGQKRKAKGREPSSRFYYEMERDQNGQPILPVEIDSWTVINLGVIDSDRPAFHTARYIYPIGYTIKKWYRSMVDAKRDTQYTCRIVDGGEEPRFQVIADDNRGTVFEGRTPTTVWTEVVRKAFAIRNLDYQHSPVGPEFFGLRKNAIAKMIQDLANANKCRKYVWQNFKPTMSGKAGRNRRRINNIGTSSPEPNDLQQPQNVINLDKPVHS